MNNSDFSNSPLFKNTKRVVGGGTAKKGRDPINKIKRDKKKKETVNQVWKPFPAINGRKFSSQEQYLAINHIREALYTGSRFIGKTDALIMSFVQHVSKGFNEQWIGVIIRLTYGALRDAIKKAKKIILNAFPAGSDNPARWLESKDAYKFIWANGEELLFRSCKTEGDYEEKMHGQEFSFVGFDELTSWPDNTVYDLMKSCNRCAVYEDRVKPPVMMRSTCNPSGIGKRWVRDYFITPERIGTVIKTESYIDGIVSISKRIAIEGNWRENPYAEIEYIHQSIIPLRHTNPSLYFEWCEGDWFQQVGSIFGACWRPDQHKLKAFDIPPSWEIWRAYDDGFHDPFSCLFFAMADGNTGTKIDGVEFCPPKGSVIVIDELYGADKNNRKKGLYWKAGKIANTIKNKERDLLETICKNHKEIEAGRAEYQIFSKKGEKSIAKIFEENGVKWKKCKKHGEASIRNRVRLMLEMLSSVIDRDSETPHLYFFENCRHLMINLFDLVGSDEDGGVPAKGQADHDFDCLGYGLQKKSGKAKIF